MDDKAEKVMRNLSSIIFDLRAENESLYDTIEMYSGRIDELRIEVSAREEVANEYKERIDKTIEVIKTKYPVLCRSEADFKEELLNILQNGSDEE